MKKMIKFLMVLIVGFVMIGGSAVAADAAKQPSGTVSINETQLALIVGGSFGGGVFKVSGFSLGANIGASKLAAAGEVYDLADVSKFAGTFTKLESSITLGGGVGGTVLKNENGVIMRLKSTSEGLQLNLSASGVTVKLDK